MYSLIHYVHKFRSKSEKYKMDFYPELVLKPYSYGYILQIDEVSLHVLAHLSTQIYTLMYTHVQVMGNLDISVTIIRLSTQIGSWYRR